MLRRAALALVALALLAGCGSGPTSPTVHSSPTSPALHSSRTSSSPPATRSAAPPTPSRTPTHKATERSRTAEKADPRWRFYSADRHRYTSPWFRGDHRIMIGFGCTRAPYYAHHAGCPGSEGFHHGIDVAMPCGTPLFSDVTGTVLAPSAPGAPGPAYGVKPFRIRVGGPGGSRDILIGHTITVFVHPGERVHPGQRIALSADSGAPDGCHLHFEVRPHGGGYESAVDPAGLLRLTAVR